MISRMPKRRDNWILASIAFGDAKKLLYRRKTWIRLLSDKVWSGVAIRYTDQPVRAAKQLLLSIHATTIRRRISLATPNYKQQKKQREEQARKKKGEKEQRKAEKKGTVLPTPNA